MLENVFLNESDNNPPRLEFYTLFQDDKTETQGINQGTQRSSKARGTEETTFPAGHLLQPWPERVSNPALTSPRKAAHSTTVVNQRSTFSARLFRPEATASDSFSGPGSARRSHCPPASRNSSSNSSVAAPRRSLPAELRAAQPQRVRLCPAPPKSPRVSLGDNPGTIPRERDARAEPSHPAGAAPGHRPPDRRAPARITLRK